jgi:hypothetical protein
MAPHIVPLGEGIESTQRPSAFRPLSVIRSLIIAPYATTHSARAVVSPSRARATICPIVKPCASIIASVQPPRLAARSSSARRRSGFGNRWRRRTWPWGREGMAGSMAARPDEQRRALRSNCSLSLSQAASVPRGTTDRSLRGLLRHLCGTFPRCDYDQFGALKSHPGLVRDRWRSEELLPRQLFHDAPHPR